MNALPRNRSCIAFLLALWACDIGDSRGNDVPRAIGSAATLVPRLAAAAGEIVHVDTVRLRLRLDAAGNPTLFAKLDLPWAARTATFHEVPLNRKWFMSIYGTSGSDTVWYGTDSGFLADTGETRHDLSSPTVVVKEFTARPQVLRGGMEIRNGANVRVGDTIILKAQGTSRIAVGGDGQVPRCTPQDSAVVHMVMAAEGSYGVTLVACEEGKWDSRRVDIGWSAIIRDSIALWSTLDTVKGNWFDWKHGPMLMAGEKLELRWSLLVLRDTLAPGVGEWRALDSMGAVGGTSVSVDSVALRREVSERLLPSDTSGRVMAKVLAYSGGAAVDSIRFWWKIRVPGVVKPVVRSVRGFGSVRYGWRNPGASRRVDAWIRTDGEWTRAVVYDSGADSLLVVVQGVAPAAITRFKLVVSDSSTGRISDTARDSASSRNPPPPPRFTVVNSRTDSAYATLALESYSESLNDVVWSVGYVRTGEASMVFSPVPDLPTSAWTRLLTEGRYMFVVRAERDDSILSDTQWCDLKGAAANRPAMPQNLHLSRRTTDSLYWEWDASPGRTYKVYWGADREQRLDSNRWSLLPAGTDHFARALTLGDSSWIAVFAQPGGDSTAGESVGAYSGIATTRLVPETVSGESGRLIWEASGIQGVELSWIALPGFRYVVSDSAGGEVDTTVLGAERASRALMPPLRTDYTFLLRAFGPDSVLSDPVKIRLHVPQVRPMPQFVSTAWIGSGGVRAHMSGSPQDMPDFMRLLAPWAAQPEAREVVLSLPASATDFVWPYDSFLLRSRPMLGIRYHWNNGDSTRLDTLPLHFAHPSLPVSWSIGSGASGDTLALDTIATPSGWIAEYQVHARGGLWMEQIPSGVYGSGVDSLKMRLLHPNASGRWDTVPYVAIGLDHRSKMSIVYLDGSTDSIWTTRIGGRTWMAENLAYDILDDTFDMCMLHDASLCSTYGRLYSASQIYSMKTGKICDTVDWGGGAGKTCEAGATDVCPIGWRLPAADDWAALAGIRTAAGLPTFRAGAWPGLIGEQTDPFGLNLQWPSWCFRDGSRYGCYDSTMGAFYPGSDPSVPGTISGAYFEVGNGLPTYAAMIWYYSSQDEPRRPSYLPVRCVKK